MHGLGDGHRWCCVIDCSESEGSLGFIYSLLLEVDLLAPLVGRYSIRALGSLLTQIMR